MSIVLFTVGGLVFVAGLIIIGLGTPASALDFGNTLIEAGTTTAVGGLIVLGLGAVVAQLQRIGEGLSARGAVRDERAVAGEREPRAPLAPAMPQPFEPRGPTPPPEFPMPQPSAAPSLPNPEEASTKSVREEAAKPVPASETTQAARPAVPPEPPPPAPTASPSEGAPATPSARQRPKSLFDSMWPAPERAEERPASKTAEPSVKPEAPPAASEPLPAPELSSAPEPPSVSAQQEAAQEPEKPRSVAILKSGVVDGMAYTLYVDGSIEAQLPQGTLRFANIQELRAHLEKGG